MSTHATCHQSHVQVRQWLCVRAKRKSVAPSGKNVQSGRRARVCGPVEAREGLELDGTGAQADLHHGLVLQRVEAARGVRHAAAWLYERDRAKQHLAVSFCFLCCRVFRVF